MRKRKKARLSIESQICLFFIGMMVGIIFLSWIMNNTLLEKYYLMNKEQALKMVYNRMNLAAENGTLLTDEFDIEWQGIMSKYNISAIILDADSRTVKCSTSEAELLVRKLLNYFFHLGEDNEDDRVSVMEKEEKYTVQIVRDVRIKTDFIEMWGVLENGNPFLIRSAVEGIRDSVDISSRFLLYIGLVMVALGVALSGFIAKKLTKPILELADISDKMKQLDFDVKYSGNHAREIELLGNNMNELSETLERTISELKTANNELIRDIEKKEKTDEMRKEFLSNVSHELKTPIALIQGYAEGLKEQVNEDPESRDFYCDVIMDEASKMNNMVQKLLNLNQLEFGYDPLVMERFDVVELIHGFLASSDILIRQKDARIRMADYEPVYVWSDEGKVEEVFGNYFSNALNHLSGERIVDIRIEKKKNSVRISVFNTGEIIPEDSIPHLWDKFYKVDKARTREYGGSGVGLSIVKAIMEGMHQDYGVINYSNGVEFWFELDSGKIREENA